MASSTSLLGTAKQAPGQLAARLRRILGRIVPPAGGTFHFLRIPAMEGCAPKELKICSQQYFDNGYLSFSVKIFDKLNHANRIRCLMCIRNTSHTVDNHGTMAMGVKLGSALQIGRAHV